MSELLYTKAYVEKTDSGEILGVASTATKDRVGDTVAQEGWDLTDFKKAPRILWGHDHSQPAIGKATKIWVDGSGKSAKLMFKMVFQEVTELGRAVKQLVNDGFLNTFSVGFQPIDGEDNGEGVGFTKQKLLEISVVNVPANPQAMMMGMKSLKEAGFNDTVIKDVYKAANMGKLRSRMDSMMSQMQEMMDMMDEMDSKPSKSADMTKMQQDIEVLKNKVDAAVKGVEYLNPHMGRTAKITEERLSLAKTIDKAATIITTGRTSDAANDVKMARTIKRANEILINSLKGELQNGKNKGTSS